MSSRTPFSIIDCHNHSLPFIDDGANDMEMALQMLDIALRCGTSDIVLTPHHLNGAFSNESELIQNNIEILKREAFKRDIDIKLHCGSEVHLVSETADQIISKKALTYCGLGKAALIELPKNGIPNGVERILSELIYNGIAPVIAHPERNSALRKDQTPLQEWTEFGCKAQLTGQSCTGGFGDALQEVSFRMIEQGLVHLIASDAHRPSGRNPDLSAAAKTITQTFDVETAKLLLHDNPQRLLKGQKLVSHKALRDKSKVSNDDKKNLSTRKTKGKKTFLQRLIEFK